MFKCIFRTWNDGGIMTGDNDVPVLSASRSELGLGDGLAPST